MSDDDSSLQLFSRSAGKPVVTKAKASRTLVAAKTSQQPVKAVDVKLVVTAEVTSTKSKTSKKRARDAANNDEAAIAEEVSCLWCSQFDTVQHRITRCPGHCGCSAAILVPVMCG